MVQPHSIPVSSTIPSAIFLRKAVSLSAKYNLPFISSPDQSKSEFVIAYTSKGLELLSLHDKTAKATSLLFVDFVHGRCGYRCARDSTIRQPLARAVGIKPGFRPTVLDGTAGLGVDAFVLSSLGCSVTMCERSPVLSALLEDGLERALGDEKTMKIVSEKLLFVPQDSCEYLLASKKSYHTIYLDPMYPQRKRSALNKQTLRIIRILVGDDGDSDKLLSAALQSAANRVVVKRQAKAPYLADIRPTHSVAMKKSRFDIYLTST
ncbi:MAG: class I SAM-dependent methyltransferase [Desulforhopalus sp.]